MFIIKHSSNTVKNNSNIKSDYLNKSKDDYVPVVNSNTVLRTTTKFKPTSKYLLYDNYLSEYNNAIGRSKVWYNLGLDKLKGTWGSILGNITDQEDLIDYFKAENSTYESLYIDVNNVKEALDLINERLFYKLPVPLSVSYSAQYYRLEQPVDIAYNGMIIDKSVYTWVINNYKNNIALVIFNNSETSLNSITENTPFTTNKSRTLKVISNFVDSKGNKPADYVGTCSLNFQSKQFYWSSTDGNIKDIVSYKNIMNGNQFNITTSEMEYIYLLFPSKKSWIHIYEQGGVDPGGEVTLYIGELLYTEYDLPITYYLYRSTYSIKGNWTIKYL